MTRRNELDQPARRYTRSETITCLLLGCVVLVLMFLQLGAPW